MAPHLERSYELLSFYGDDFTGSTDSMEALAINGIRTVLFLEYPTSDMMARFLNIQAFGIAGTSRSMSPSEMEDALLPVFQFLKSRGTPIVQ